MISFQSPFHGYEKGIVKMEKHNDVVLQVRDQDNSGKVIIFATRMTE